MRVKRIIDLSEPFEEGGYNNPAFEDGRVEVIMRHETEGWHAEMVHTATHLEVSCGCAVAQAEIRRVD